MTSAMFKNNHSSFKLFSKIGITLIVSRKYSNIRYIIEQLLLENVLNVARTFLIKDM